MEIFFGDLYNFATRNVASFPGAAILLDFFALAFFVAMLKTSTSTILDFLSDQILTSEIAYSYPSALMLSTSRTVSENGCNTIGSRSGGMLLTPYLICHRYHSRSIMQ